MEGFAGPVHLFVNMRCEAEGCKRVRPMLFQRADGHAVKNSIAKRPAPGCLFAFSPGKIKNSRLSHPLEVNRLVEAFGAKGAAKLLYLVYVFGLDCGKNVPGGWLLFWKIRAPHTITPNYYCPACLNSVLRC
jgi:hypothetical protein